MADYHYDDDYEFPAALNESNLSIFDPFLRDGYQEDEDEDWTPDIEYVEDDVYLNDENCYEDIKGVVNLTTEFCKTFLPDAGPLYLNMFSTLDHTSYCLAHVWTFRRLEVLGLADTPTDGAPGLSGQKRFRNFCSCFKSGVLMIQVSAHSMTLTVTSASTPACSPSSTREQGWAWQTLRTPSSTSSATASAPPTIPRTT